MKRPLGDKTTAEIAAIAEEKGCRLLAIETAGAGRFTVLRLVLDAADEIAHRYTLEVSSAGLDRKLYSLDDARRFVGRRVRVKTDDPVVPEARRETSGKTPALSPARNFAGRLESVEGDRLTVVDELEHKTYNVRFGDIRLARLDFEWPRREGPGR